MQRTPTLLSVIGAVVLVSTLSSVVLAWEWEEREPDSEMTLKALRGLPVSATDAVEIALREEPGVVYQVDIVTQDGFLAWEVDLVSEQNLEMEIEIDVRTGQIIEARVGQWRS